MTRPVRFDRFDRVAARRTLALAAAAVFCAAAAEPEPDVVVVGAGCGGLSTALEAARGGARVTVVDVASVFGGHAVVAEGGLSFAGTPLQRSLGITDHPDFMYEDMIRLGEDADPAVVRRYADQSLVQVHDWLFGMGVRFHSIGSVFGSRVARFHLNPQRGFGIVAPIYRACLEAKTIKFAWNTRVTRLIVEQGRVVGVEGANERNGERFGLRAPAVVLATGGFQSNLALVKKHWPVPLAMPAQLMSGAGLHAQGEGLALATQVGAGTHRLDHQWNYPRGIPDPRYPGSNRGLSLNRITFPWINARGRRFVEERGASHVVLRAMLAQPGARAWLVFDDEGKVDLEIAGTDWKEWTRVEREILANPAITIRAPTLALLAKKTGLPAAELARSVARWNGHIVAGEDPDFGRFSRSKGTFASAGIRAPRPIRRAPFYAIVIRPITRKSLGGLAVDLQGRVLDAQQRPIAGLHAVGELTGFGGVNGKASIEGTFIAPTILQGRTVGRALAASRAPGRAPAATSAAAPSLDVAPKRLDCAVCHPMQQLLDLRRRGYWHFDRVHEKVVRERRDCLQCHAEMTPYHPERHKIDRLAQIAVCAHCHLPR